MQPRRKQPPITIRSARAVELLKKHTTAGRSQAQVIEEALERLPAPDPLDPALREIRKRQVEELLSGLSPGCLPTTQEFDAADYDEHGNPR